MPDRDDAELMRLAGGDLAFEKLVERQQNRVIGTEAAEDIAQQVFVVVWQSAPRYPRRSGWR
jgi:RNA polymerase sigma-70 factor (ECF subfamily)